MGSHSVICHPAEVRILPLPQPKQVLDLATPEGCMAELTYLGTGLTSGFQSVLLCAPFSLCHDDVISPFKIVRLQKIHSK